MDLDLGGREGKEIKMHVCAVELMVIETVVWLWGCIFLCLRMSANPLVPGGATRGNKAFPP